MVRDYRIDLPARMIDCIRNARAPTAGDSVFANNEVHVIASARVSLEAAADRARSLGVQPLILSDSIEGEAKDIGRMHAALAREFEASPRLQSLSCCFPAERPQSVSELERTARGAETPSFFSRQHRSSRSRRRRGNGRGHRRNRRLGRQCRGAFCDGGTVARIRNAGGDARTFLAGHDAWSAFNLTGRSLRAGAYWYECQ